MKRVDITLEIPDDLEFVLNSILHYRKIEITQFIVETIYKELEYWKTEMTKLFAK